jgi:hypothetical protein
MKKSATVDVRCETLAAAFSTGGWINPAARALRLLYRRNMRAESEPP